MIENDLFYISLFFSSHLRRTKIYIYYFIIRLNFIKDNSFNDINNQIKPKIIFQTINKFIINLSPSFNISPDFAHFNQCTTIHIRTILQFHTYLAIFRNLHNFITDKNKPFIGVMWFQLIIPLTIDG